ncbi:MAG: phage tail protein, partial [Lacticaseibacillus rhamnosus]
YVDLTPRYFSQTFPTDTPVSWTHEKLELGTSASPWSPNPADPEYYSDTITVHNGGTYPVEPVITATMHADNGMVGIVNDRPGILQFGTQEIDGFTTEESEVALDLAAVQGSHMDNQAATNNPYWGGDPSMPNEQVGNAIWTHDDYDGWKVEPNWPSITGDHKYWNGPSIKHNLVQTHNGNFKSNLTWDVMTRFQTGVSKVGALETTLESDGKPIFQMILKDNSALSDQLWWMCYYKDQLVVNEQLDHSIFTNDKFIQLELQKFGNSVVFRVSPWVGNQGRETTITRQFTFADAADVETKQFSTWFMRDKTWGESTMYLIASTVKWQNVSWYTNIKNRFSNGDVLKIDVANAKTYLNGSLDPTMHTLGNQWEQFKLPPGDTKIAITPSSWAQPFACEVEIREAWL